MIAASSAYRIFETGRFVESALQRAEIMLWFIDQYTGDSADSGIATGILARALGMDPGLVEESWETSLRFIVFDAPGSVMSNVFEARRNADGVVPDEVQAEFNALFQYMREQRNETTVLHSVLVQVRNRLIMLKGLLDHFWNAHREPRA